MAGKEAERVELLRKSKWEIVRRTFPEARIKSPAARIVKHWKRQVTLYGDDDVPAEEVRKERPSFRQKERGRLSGWEAVRSRCASRSHR